ncbi:MAG: isoprenylcysteine carboxylmethyltransferase family protein [Pseudodesulfovibrio sp.]
MEVKRQSYFGQGPKIFRPAILWALAAAVVTWLWSDLLRFSNPALQPVSSVVGWVLILLGAGLYFWGLKHMVRAVRSGQLDTSGPFAIVRHPMYSAWIVMIFPGIALVSGAWLISGASIVGWFAFRTWAQAEEVKLVELFGPAYEEYAAKTPAVIPFLV